MQCCVAPNCPSLWPCQVLRSRGETTVGRSADWASCPGRKAWGGQLVCSGSRSRSRSRSSPSFLLGFLGNGILSAHTELQKWTDDWCLSIFAAAAERKEGGRAHASLLVDPAVWIIRTTVFYVLVETGVAAPGRFWSASDSGDRRSENKGPLAWIGKLVGGDPEEKRNKELAKLRSKWQTNTKGILVRRYRVPSKAVGRKLLNGISSLLAEDDTFRDVATHKGCQIRRENAHAESVCCHNVRALFDELPTPHLVVEITGPVTSAHYEKADKLEKVLRSGASI